MFFPKRINFFFKKKPKYHEAILTFVSILQLLNFLFLSLYVLLSIQEFIFFSYVIIKFRKIYLHDWLVWMYKTVLANLIPYYFFFFFSILPCFSCFMLIYACFASVASTHQFSLWAQHLKCKNNLYSLKFNNLCIFNNVCVSHKYRIHIIFLENKLSGS